MRLVDPSAALPVLHHLLPSLLPSDGLTASANEVTLSKYLYVTQTECGLSRTERGQKHASHCSFLLVIATIQRRLILHDIPKDACTLPVVACRLLRRRGEGERQSLAVFSPRSGNAAPGAARMGCRIHQFIDRNWTRRHALFSSSLCIARRHSIVELSQRMFTQGSHDNDQREKDTTEERGTTTTAVVQRMLLERTFPPPFLAAVGGQVSHRGWRTRFRTYSRRLWVFYPEASGNQSRGRATAAAPVQGKKRIDPAARTEQYSFCTKRIG